MIFDSHAHYDDERFDIDREELLGSVLPRKNVCGVVTCGTDVKGAADAVSIAQRYDYIYAAVGIYPKAGTADIELSEIAELARSPKVVAIGEIGLEYHYKPASRDEQIKLFESQIIMANQIGLPIIVHDREAHADTLMLLQKHCPKGVVHCFSGSVETAREILDLGMYIGLGGAVTFKNARHPVEVARYIPSDRLLLETDAPYMAPVPFRGSRCDSSMIDSTAERIAEIRGVDKNILLDETAENARRLFGITV